MGTTKTVLVTGANGFIGRETVKHLASEGWTVFPAMRRFQDISAIELDLEDPAFPGKLMQLPRIDAIIHLAARVDFGIDTLTQLYSVNVAATAALLELAKHWNATFVFASSALVAGMSMVQIDADAPERPDTPYSKSKWLAEQLVKASGVRSVVLRIGGVFGLDGPDHLGLNRAIKAVVSGKVPSQIGTGEAKRNYIFVKDVAAVIREVLAQEIVGTHLVAGKEVLTVAEMLNILCEVFMPGQSPERHDGPHAMDQIIIPSRSLTPSRNFREAVTDMYAYSQQ